MIISFAKTTEQVRYGLKTVTRRYWSERHLAMWQKAFDDGRLIHDGWTKSPHRGGEPLAKIRLTARPYQERLGDITKGELIAEGFPHMTKREFYDLIGGHRDDTVAVLRFETIPTFEIVKWTGCFKRAGKRRDDLTPGAVQHPAKMSLPLIARIWQEARARVLLPEKPKVADPFAGVGSVAAVVCRLGHDCDLFEIAPAYVAETAGMICPGLLSDQWDQVLANPDAHRGVTVCPACVDEVLRADYHNRLFGKCTQAHLYPGLADILDRERSAGKPTGRLLSRLEDSRRLSELTDTLYDMVITSPPYEDVVRGQGTGPSARYDHDFHPPDAAEEQSAPNIYAAAGAAQLGALKGDDYDREITAVYRECFQVLRPGRYMVVNVKNFIRDKTVVNLEGKTIQLLTSAGFTLDFVARAMLIEGIEQLPLLDGMVRQVGYETMHRKAYRRKHGFAIDYESVIFAYKPQI